MPTTWLHRAMLGLVALGLAALVLPATLVHAALPTATETPAPASLAGQLLVAAPTMSDPRFDHAVILMVQHSHEGALGIVINMPIEERPLASLLEMLGETDTTVTGKVQIFTGGPVQPDIGFVIHTAEYHRSGTIDIDGRLAMTSSGEVLHDIGHSKGPDKSLVAFGYAGWGPGQVEDELEHRAWFTAAGDLKLIFDEERTKVWEIAFSHRTQDL